MAQTPNIVTGTVTNRARSHRTPNWLRALYAVLTAFVLITAIGMIPQVLS
jgi:hypothetical protein